MTLKQWRRQLATLIFPPLVWGFIVLIWKTCRVRSVIGHEHIQELLNSRRPFIPCYWHQQQIFCVRFLLDSAAANEQLKLGYLISPSSDGDMATSMFSNQGVHIIRGSATRGGAQALREIYTSIRKNNISPIVTPDGPTGPIYQCKAGVPMLAQLSGAPLLPMAYAGTRVWTLRSWDKFMLPVPFSTVVIGIGPAIYVHKADMENDFENACRVMNDALDRTARNCQRALEGSKTR